MLPTAIDYTSLYLLVSIQWNYHLLQNDVEYINRTSLYCIWPDSKHIYWLYTHTCIYIIYIYVCVYI